MSSRRKEMWKLLYNYVQRSEADPNDVFAFVDDILCKEPSLLRPYSLRELNNRFQDTLILWLINRFIKCLGEKNREEIHLKNVKLQQKILSSCLVNRTSLFERLMESYVRAIEQLAVELPDAMDSDEEAEHVLEIDAFTSEDTCLREIDPDFSFQNIQVRADDVDARIQPLLHILRHGLTIGYSVYPTVFVNAMQSVFKALKECDLPTKLLCLRYCQTLFQATYQLSSLMEYYYELAVRSIALMLVQLPVWLHAECVQPDELDTLFEISALLLETQCRFAKRLQCRQQLLQLSYGILHNVSEILQMPKQQLRNFSTSKLDTFLKILIKFTMLLQLQDGHRVLPSAEQTLVILHLADEHAQALRLIAIIITQQDSSDSSNLLTYLKEKLTDLLSNASNRDLEVLKELLTALIFIEHHQCQEQQFILLKAQNSIDYVGNLKTHCNLFVEISDQVWSSALNGKVENFLINAENTKVFEQHAEKLEIAGLLLNTVTLRNLYSTQLQQKLIAFIERPARVALSSAQSITSNDRELAYISMRTLCSLSIEEPREVFTILQRIIHKICVQLFTSSATTEITNELLRAFCSNLTNLLVTGLISRHQILTDFIKPSLQNTNILCCLLKSICCTNNSDSCHIFKLCPYMDADKGHHINSNHIEIVCAKCTHHYKTSEDVVYMRERSGILLKWSNTSHQNIPDLPVSLKRSLCQIIFKDEQFSFVGNHLELTIIRPDDCFQVLSSTADISTINLRILQTIVPHFVATEDVKFLTQMAKFVLQQTLKSLQSQEKPQQLYTLELISCCAASKLSEHWLFHFFKMTFFYLIHPDSSVVQEAVLCATEMCAKYKVQPTQLWNWYKRDALSLIVKLAVFVYLKKGVRLTRSLKAFTKMLGFSCVQEFICKYYRLLATMILPYCVKEPFCKGLIVSISKITRKPISTLFVVSFLRIYTHIYLTEEAAIGNQCIDLIVKCTAYSLNKLMNTDVKQTVSEFLIYFNRNPKFVMQAFQCLLLHESSTPAASTSALSTPSSEFSKFIADRFLGVITYFETCLAEPNFEKPLKEEALYSLGQIIRFVGANHVTQFRFKIIAMLSFVLSLNDRHLQSICLKIWNIFLHIVNIRELGPSLSRIVASLQPLLEHSPAEVNAIYEFVIMRNDSLLGTYIPDLYFVENIVGVAPEIRQCVARQTEMLKSDKSTVLDKIGFLYKQITNENLQVRIYGLSHMRTFIAAQRSAINNIVLNEIVGDPLIENVVDILVAGCRHEDRNLQLASAKCLGELGAIDPSYMPSNYSFEQTIELPLSIHTDDFAIMALTELCRSYQFQKDTKYVDNFSLAIQETLSVCGVSPNENKKTNVWKAIPERMRQVMEPLLTSCYTGSRRESKCKEHPIFNSSFCRSYEDWGFAWASRLIDFVQTEDTKHLLNSYKPSIKRDNNTMALIFPYIVLHALQECNEAQMQQIFEEFESVFNFSSRGVIAQPEYETSGMKEFLSTKYSVDRSLDSVRKSSSAEKYEALDNITRTCTKLCSEQIDFLQRWMRDWQRMNQVDGKISESNGSYKRIEVFLEKLDKYMIAKANYNSGEFARALMYLEEYIEGDSKVRMQEQMSFLIEIHGNLMDADSVEGAVYMKKSNLNLAEEILFNRIVDRPQETITCYEQLMSSDEQIHQEHIKGMIDCYLRMDTPETALLITDGLWQKLTDQYTDDYFKECKSELLWRLGRYDELQELLEDSVVRRNTTNWNIQCAEAFLLFRQQPVEFERFVDQLDIIRSNVLCTMRTCSGFKQNSYPHSYDEVVKLHLLNEVEKNKLLLNHVVECLMGDCRSDQENCVDRVRQFFDDWDDRLCVLQPIVRIMEPILCFRRNLLIESKRLMSQNSLPSSNANAPQLLKKVGDLVDTEIGKLWIRSVQMNRDAGSLQQAHISIMKAEQYAPKTLFIEKAKVLWEKGDQTNSFKLIAENLERIEVKCQRDIRTLDAFDRALYAEAKFLQATYNAESMNICSELNLRYFKEAILGNRHSEKCHVQLAQYMEKIYESFSKDQKDGENGRKLILDIMLNYIKSLRCGFENVYQSLPRLLSLWLDLTSQCVAISEAASSSETSALGNKYGNGLQELARKINDVIHNCSNVLPTSIFYTAFSQLLSRICHPSHDVFLVLRNIVIKLVEHFPHQSLWMLLPILKSSHTNRVKRCKLIFTESRLAKPKFQKLLTDFNMLAERLIELTNKEVALDRPYELSMLVKQLPKLFEDPSFSEILLPFEKYMQASFPITSSSASMNLNLPSSCQENASGPPIPKNPFPYKQIFICGIKEEVTVLRSAAKPKKITIRCNDGKHYDVMIKPKDDLRKDFRLMEFNGLVKRYLHQDSQARHRRLRIRTYAAIPFNEECGLVEWLPNLNSFRGICTTIYRTRGLGIPDRKLRQCALLKSDPIEAKRSMFTGTLLAHHPPVFHEWFLQRFSTPRSWYEARSAYVKTTASMSMVGYILGLGDRHGENVLFDETNGDAVHVDFNCLFNQGECFAYPELVPFRLTQNMVFAMGPLGVEGMYRKCCEITLRVLKHESKTLMSVLRPFVYDLVVLNRNYSKKQTTAELTDPKAMVDVRRIEERLQGYVKKTLANSMPLSTEGQVNFLITEATDIDNLASMYIGWGSYI